jgi:hypothetical protein
METTERIVEAYTRYVKRWATIPNIRCSGQLEIDLLAVDPATLKRYHIETGVSISETFCELTDKPFSQDILRTRSGSASQRRTFGYFLERKFGHPSILETLKRYGFEQGEYGRIIVSWGWAAGVDRLAADAGIELWDFRELLEEIVRTNEDGRSYHVDDTCRTLHLYSLVRESR